MMRALFSGVAGLKTHQTRMDVIGNNIANVNTVGFKASNVVFSDVFYQTTQATSGPNGDTGTGGINSKQIGLGSQVSAISKTMDLTGGSQTTNNAFDCMISGNNFFIVKNNQGTLFTKDGAFTTDADGNLVTADGAYVQGWMASQDSKTKQYVVNPKQIEKLSIMSPENSTINPEATEASYISGNIDKNDELLKNKEEGRNFQINYFDNLGYKYTAKFSMIQSEADTSGRTYIARLMDIVDGSGNSMLVTSTSSAGVTTYKASSTYNVAFGEYISSSTGQSVNAQTAGIQVSATTGKITLQDTSPRFTLHFTADGKLDVASTSTTVANRSATDKTKIWFNINDVSRPKPQHIAIDFSTLTMYANSDSSSIESTMGDLQGNHKGYTKGTMTGCSIDKSGKIYGNYDNGKQRLLGQIATTTFKNPGGLEAIGGNYFRETQNSGSFDGVGKDVSANGGKIDTGMLEMSNVDLAGQFTDMITTQRGFQANSRIITVSDTLLEELVNLKR